jgi:hypothetical protein
MVRLDAGLNAKQAWPLKERWQTATLKPPDKNLPDGANAMDAKDRLRNIEFAASSESIISRRRLELHHRRLFRTLTRGKLCHWLIAGKSRLRPEHRRECAQ